MIQPDSLLKVASMGGVDCGKSTLLARLLARFNPAYSKASGDHEIFDTLEIERSQKITFSVAHQYGQWGSTRLHFMDDPGHLHLLPHTLSGLWRSDLVLYVMSLHQIDGELLNLHGFLLKWLEKTNVVNILNQCDRKQWNANSISEAFCIAKENLPAPRFEVPVSALTEENIFENKGETPCLFDWLSKYIETTRNQKTTVAPSLPLAEAIFWDFCDTELSAQSQLRIMLNNRDFAWSEVAIRDQRNFQLQNKKVLDWVQIALPEPNTGGRQWGLVYDPIRAQAIGLVKT